MFGFQGIRRPPLRHAELVDLMGHDQYGSRPSYRGCRCERPSAVGLGHIAGLAGPGQSRLRRLAGVCRASG